MTSFAKGFGQKLDGFTTEISPVGFDNGNGNPKAVIDGHPVIFPAYICPDFVTDSVDRFAGLVQIDGRNYLTGESAQFTGSAARTSDDEARKAEYALPMLLGAIARLPYRPQWDLRVVASAQSADIRAQIPERLNGRHEVILNNVDRSVVNIRVLATVPEGATVSAFYPGAVAVIDIGCGDLQSLVVQQYKVLKSTRYRGFDWVATKIYNDLKAKGRGVDLMAIRSAIDAGTFETGGLSPLKFREQYDAALQAWFTSQLEPVLRGVESLSGIQKVVAIGGGLLNKQIREYLLRQYTIAIPESPELFSAKALYKIAETKIRGN